MKVVIDTNVLLVCIISHDRDFLPLKNLPFPKVEVIDTEVFKLRLGI
jgi:hypothetical protein